MVEAMLHTFVSFVFCEYGGKLQCKHDYYDSPAGNCFLKQLYKDWCCSCIKVKISGQSNPLRLPDRFSLDPETLSGIKPTSSVQEQPLGK